jgi:arsenate reductase (thioredoxin)
MRRKILFLCTGNSARSILAELILRQLAGDRLEVASAGSFPKGQVHPLALETLRELGLDTAAARSKSWTELEGVELDLVITLCDDAREACPIWPGQPVVAHWGMPDPAAVAGTHEERLAAFRDTARVLQRRLELLRDLLVEGLDRPSLASLVRDIASV